MYRLPNRILVVLTLFILIKFCPSPLVGDSRADDKSGTFSGTWVANGSKDTLSFGVNREAALFRLSGHVNLKNGVGNERDYWSECIGLADSETGSTIRCVWTGINDTKIFLVLKGEGLSRGNSVTGDIVGGTGTAEGITGMIQFEWSSMSTYSVNDITSVGGYAKELSGSYKLP